MVRRVTRSPPSSAIPDAPAAPAAATPGEAQLQSAGQIDFPLPPFKFPFPLSGAASRRAQGDVGFPKDFPELIDQGGAGRGQRIGGFGGDKKLDREGNRRAVQRNPVILVHGNAGHATHPEWGMEAMRDHLKEAGYRDSEIWALSYLGPDNTSISLPNPISENVGDLRAFIDAVRKYLGVKKVDIIGHSLGVSLTRGYLNGLQADGTFDVKDNRLDTVGTMISLAGANNGLGQSSVGEFKTGSPVEHGLHVYGSVVDDTPGGKSKPPGQGVTKLDDGSHVYGAFSAKGDFVESQLRGTGRLEGADINEEFEFRGEGSLRRHELMIKDPNVFKALLPLLNQRR